MLATTRHPLIISLYYSFQSRSRLYFVMDYCAGGEFYRTIQVRQTTTGSRKPWKGRFVVLQARSTLFFVFVGLV